MANSDSYFLASTAEVGVLDSVLGYIRTFCLIGKSSDGSTIYDGAMRFSNIAVNQGTSVSAASLYIYTDSQGSGGSNLKFITYCIDEDDTADFSSSPFGRAKTTASDTADNPLPGVGNYKQVTVTSLVNEVFARGGWSSGNHLGFLMEDNGSATDVYIATSDALSVLTIQINALPDFTPGPYSVSQKSPRPAEDYGLKVVTQGHDAETPTSNYNNIALLSRLDVLKTIKSGQLGWPTNSNLESVSHQLKYSPAFMVFFQDGSKIHLTPRGFTGVTGEAGGVVSYGDPESINVALDPNRADIDAWYYYVFIDENL